MLDRVDVHCVWVSRAVLDLLPADIPDIPGGEVVREPGLGVFCDNAMNMVMALWPAPGPDRKKAFVRSAMRELNRVGLVGMHDAGATRAHVDLFEDMVRDARDGKDEWSVRVYAMHECEKRNSFCPREARKVEDERGFLTVRSVKLFAGAYSVPPFATPTRVLRC